MYKSLMIKGSILAVVILLIIILFSFTEAQAYGGDPTGKWYYNQFCEGPYYDEYNEIWRTNYIQSLELTIGDKGVEKYILWDPTTGDVFYESKEGTYTTYVEGDRIYYSHREDPGRYDYFLIFRDKLYFQREGDKIFVRERRVPHDDETHSAVWVTSANGLNLRSEPDTNSKVVTELPHNEVYSLLGRQGDWSAVRCYLNGQNYYGYVHSAYISAEQQPEENANRKPDADVSSDKLTTFDDLAPQRAIFPMASMRITQGINSNPSHKGNNYYAIDLGGADTGVDDVFAPFDAEIVHIDIRPTKDSDITNTVFIQSQKKVLFADGTLDYMVIRFAHDNNISDLQVGQSMEQGHTFYQEGTAGASSNHVHMVISRGKLDKPNRYKSDHFIHPADALVIDPRYTTAIIDNEKYDWVYSSSETDTDPARSLVSTWIGRINDKSAYLEYSIDIKKDGQAKLSMKMGETGGMSIDIPTQDATYTVRDGKIQFLLSDGTPLSLVLITMSSTVQDDYFIPYSLSDDVLTFQDCPGSPYLVLYRNHSGTGIGQPSSITDIPPLAEENDSSEASEAYQTELENPPVIPGTNSKVLLSVPFYNQNYNGIWANNCGQTCTMMLEQYFKPSPHFDKYARLKEINQQFGTKDGDLLQGKSTKIKDIMEIIKWMGFQTVITHDDAEQTLENLKAYLNQGQPVIVHVFGRYEPRYPKKYPYSYIPREDLDGGHIIILIGYDDETGEIIINDSGTNTGKEGRYSYEVFEKIWSASNKYYRQFAVVTDQSVHEKPF